MATSSTSSTSSPGFNGTSSFSTDFQSVITRAVAIANLPITQLQNQQNTLTGQQTELQTLGGNFQSLQSALGTLDSSASAGSFGVSVDATAVASATLGAGSLPGSYSVNITNLGAHTNTISNASLPVVSDPTSGNISTSSAFTLTVGGKPISLNPATTSLNSLVQAINTSGANVQATIVNVGGSTSPNYQLSIQGTQYANTSIQLNDGTQDLLNTLNPPGANVAYQVNGSTTVATSTSRDLSISTGLTVTALTTGTANVTVSQNASGVQNALSSLVTSYNAAVDQLAKNRGQSGGALAGNSVISELSNVLHNLTNYSSASSSGPQSLTDLGVTFDQAGHLQFDSTVFNAASSNSPSAVASFLGSVSGGTGFLSAANTALTAATDTTSGIVATATNSIGATVTTLTAKITSDQAYVTQLQTNLTAQMAKADAAVASLQQQVTEITNLFAAQAQAAKNITG